MEPLSPRRFAAPLVFGVVLASTLQAQAQIGPITSGPGGSPVPPVIVPVPQDPMSYEFDFGSPPNRVQVDYATGAGAFEKWLTPDPDQNADGTVDMLDLNLFLAQPILTLNEYLTVGAGGPAWTDWHEEILTPDWQWGVVSISTPGAVGPANLTINQSGPKVDFYFDPLVPGTDVDIRKELFFNGTFTPQMASDFLSGHFAIRVAEYPTSVPEPVALPLVGLALCGAAMVRLRRRWDDEALHKAEATTRV